MAESGPMMIKQWKDSAKKKKLKRRRNAIQNIFMMKRNLFAKPNEEQAIQYSNPQEASEDINLDIKEEDPRGIMGLDLSYSSTKKKGKEIQGKGVCSANHISISRADVPLFDAFGVTVSDIQKLIAI